ncbi:hypothetical protein N7478_008591 [Penicillium angulare]|uniref:uncharacterized protein n=1 Tax=Penicillium angulare TaxID=116970 RepID=UPI0025414654|nr:uncharacterized protein N7478_008591 [Penicillium angulare]KAJ5273466.1 hypothetical protein N7478_008591 [Penicillium angulare]
MSMAQRTNIRLGRLNSSSVRPSLLQQIRLIVSKSSPLPAPNKPRALKIAHNLTPHARLYTTQPNISDTPTKLKETLTPALLEDVRNFWFSHINDEESLILPGGNEMQRWFTRDINFDKACVTQFQPALEAIIETGATAPQILSAVNPTPLTYLSLLLLLDQVSRNCYRGEESKLVFTRFDPLASEIAVQALSLGIPLSPEIRYKVAYRFWFPLPLMHSEALSVHQQAIKVLEEKVRDFEAFLDMERDSLGQDEKRCFDVLRPKKNMVKEVLERNLDFERRHLVIIERFGRYPHRNDALGRVSTKEEVEYLENGGETFG